MFKSFVRGRVSICLCQGWAVYCLDFFLEYVPCLLWTTSGLYFSDDGGPPLGRCPERRKPRHYFPLLHDFSTFGRACRRFLDSEIFLLRGQSGEQPNAASECTAGPIYIRVTRKKLRKLRLREPRKSKEGQRLRRLLAATESPVCGGDECKILCPIHLRREWARRVLGCCKKEGCSRRSRHQLDFLKLWLGRSPWLVKVPELSIVFRCGRRCFCGEPVSEPGSHDLSCLPILVRGGNPSLVSGTIRNRRKSIPSPPARARIVPVLRFIRKNRGPESYGNLNWPWISGQNIPPKKKF